MELVIMEYFVFLALSSRATRRAGARNFAFLILTGVKNGPHVLIIIINCVIVIIIINLDCINFVKIRIFIIGILDSKSLALNMFRMNEFCVSSKVKIRGFQLTAEI